MWSRSIKSKKAFILLEIMLSLTLLSVCLPFVSTDPFSYKKELQKAQYVNQIENQLSKIMFHLYYELHKDFYYSKIKEQRQGELILDEPIKLNNKPYPIMLTFSHHEKGTNNDFIQLNYTLKVTNLPLGLADYQTNEQNIYLKN